MTVSKSTVKRGTPSPLRALQPIETFDIERSDAIVPIVEVCGTAVPAEERMAARVHWAERAGYAVVETVVPVSFRPYNAVIRVSEKGTEDRQRDYLAHLVFETEVIE